jgi:predicted metal-dependent hydrolase
MEHLQHRSTAYLADLELAKKPVPCLKYIVANELVHLIERDHYGRFV